MNFEILTQHSSGMNDAPFEVVERKGRGHPDTICDLLAERISHDLAQYYQKECGRVLHYNVDKALLVGGVVEPHFGGGKIVEPVKFYLGGQAIASANGMRFDLDGVVEGSIASWLSSNLRFLRLGENLVWKNEVKPGSAILNGVEERAVSNDTSVGVGHWPPSNLEAMTLAVEEYMNAPVFKARYPETGEDIKVMAIRQGKSVDITIACAMVDRFIAGVDDYMEKKNAIQNDVSAFLKEKYHHYHVSLSLNALDDPARGEDGLYLTVTGLSCEGGDSGQVGRGNRVNGLISFMRLQTMEAWAGKNSRTHVGRIYSFAAQALARKLAEEIPGISDATVMLAGKIGAPVNRPPHVFADLKMWGHNHTMFRDQAEKILKNAIEDGAIFQPEALDIVGLEEEKQVFCKRVSA